MHTKYLQNILSIEELAEKGISKNQIHTRLKRGELLRSDRGVYVYSDFARSLTDFERPLARIVSAAKCSNQLVLSHISAALWWGAPLLEKPELVHFSVPTNSTRRQVSTKIHRNRLQQCESSVIHQNLPVTSIVDTLLDCTVAYPVLTALTLGNYFLKEELIEYQTASEALLDPGLYRSGRCQQVQELLNPYCESPLETLIWFRIKGWGIELPAQQVWIDCGGGQKHRADFLWWGPKVILEADGKVKYSGIYGKADEVIRQERARQRNLERQGWTVLRVEWSEVQNQPRNLLARLNAAGVR